MRAVSLRESGYTQDAIEVTADVVDYRALGKEPLPTLPRTVRFNELPQPVLGGTAGELTRSIENRQVPWLVNHYYIVVVHFDPKSKDYTVAWRGGDGVFEVRGGSIAQLQPGEVDLSQTNMNGHQFLERLNAVCRDQPSDAHDKATR